MQIGHAKSITIADVTGTMTGWLGGTTASVAASAAQLPSDWNSRHNLHFTLGGNTTVGSTFTGTNLPFVATGDLKIGISASSLYISGGTTQGDYRPFDLGNNTSFSSLGQNSIYLQHFIPEFDMAGDRVELWARGSFVSSSNSMAYSQTIRYGIYTQGTGTQSTRMSLAGSSSMLIAASFNSTSAAGFTVSQGAASFTTSAANTTLLANVSGPFHLYLPFATTLSKGIKHAFGILISSATAVGTQAMRFAPLVLTVMNSLAMGRINTAGTTATATTVIGDREMGIYNTTSGGLVGSFATSQLAIAASRQKLYLQFEA
jgi:hypothetical protein